MYNTDFLLPKKHHHHQEAGNEAPRQEGWPQYDDAPSRSHHEIRAALSVCRHCSGRLQTLTLSWAHRSNPKPQSRTLASPGRQRVGSSHRMGQAGQGHRGTRPGRSQGRAGCLSAELLRVMVTGSAQPTISASGSTSETWPEASLCSPKLKGKTESSEAFMMGSRRQALVAATTACPLCRIPGLLGQPQKHMVGARRPSRHVWRGPSSLLA